MTTPEETRTTCSLPRREPPAMYPPPPCYPQQPGQYHMKGNR